MNTDEDHLKENHSDNAWFLRRRRAASLRQLEASTATSQGEEQDQEQLQKKVQWEELHCRASTTSNNNSGYGDYGPGWEPVVSEYLPEQGDLSSPESIATSTALLHPSLSVVGTNFCAEGNETKFEFQHFWYQAIPSHQQQPPQGWYVNCCDFPQQLDNNYNLDSPISQTTVAPDGCPLVIPDLTSSTQTRVNAQIVVSCVAAFLSLSMILAITLPLLKKRTREKASTFNLYLAFLSVPDLIYNIFLVWLFVEFDRLTCDRDAEHMPRINHPWDLALFIGIAVASLYINATIAWEILKLLRNSKKRKRSKAPSLKKASIQAGCSYMLGLTMGYVDFFFGDYLKKAPKWILVLTLWNLAVGFPLFYMIYVCIQIWREQLLGERGTKVGKRLSVLVRYFARLVFVYIGIFLPASILYSLQWDSGVYYWWGCILYSLQVWVSFIFALTKPDVRKNVIDLFTFKACRSDQNKQATMNFLVNTKPKTTSTPKSREKQHTTSCSTGYDNREIIKDRANGHVDQDPITSDGKEVECDGNGDGKGKDNVKKKEDSDASDGNNSNVFEFDVADAPIVHANGSDHRVRRSSLKVFGRSKRAEARRNSSAELAQTAEQVRNT